MLDFFKKCVRPREKARRLEDEPAGAQAQVLANESQPTCAQNNTSALVHIAAEHKSGGALDDEHPSVAAVEQLYSCLTNLTQAATNHDGWLLNLEGAVSSVRDHFGASTAWCVRGVQTQGFGGTEAANMG